MSLIRSTQLNGHEPLTYLKDVLTRCQHIAQLISNSYSLTAGLPRCLIAAASQLAPVPSPGAYLTIISVDVAVDLGRVNAKTPPRRVGFLTWGEPDDYLLSHGQSALSSAWSRFTVLFGMGRG
ncbi:hypothetical protein HDG38_004425, partial [Paraburkholderia sp. WSM4177]|nr:hypothetical protein [Paraburkholderia sp. WSM4177]MBB5486155.1 hypothetical protein [Paraburkholderia sp. WSM4180]